MGVWGDIGAGFKRVGHIVPGVGEIMDSIENEPDPHAADAEANAARDRAREVADKAAADAEAAKQRHTEAGFVDVGQAGPVNVGTTPINPGATVKQVGATTAPNMDTVNPGVAASAVTPESTKDLGNRVAGGTHAEQAQDTSLRVDQTGLGYQNQAAGELAAILRGDRPSVAAEQLKAAQDRAAAEQLSIAAGARGQGVAAARRNAANNISLQQVEAGGQAAQLRAQEIASAAQGLGQVGAQVQGQSLQQGTTQAQLEQTTELTNVKARNDAIQSAQERFARGEITQAQLDTEIAKANASFQEQTNLANQQTQKELAIEKSRQQLQADLASDDRLQQSFNLQAQLQQQAQAGNQDAAVRLQALQAQIDADIGKFNANQIQTASAANIQNRLAAMHLDDTFVAEMSRQWLEAERSGNQAALDALRIKLGQAAAAAAQDASWRAEMRQDLGAAAQGLSGGTAPTGGGGGAAAGYSGAGEELLPMSTGGSDRRLKTDVREIPPAAVDDFLRTVGANKTWRYRDPGQEGVPDAPRVGPMAQDMARTELGRSAVSTRPDGMMALDRQQMAALALAGLGRVSDRLDQVEGKKGKAPPDEAGFLRARRGRAA